MKNIGILGSTGVIGKKTLEVVRHFPQEFTVKALSAKTNSVLLEQQAHEFKPEVVYIESKEQAFVLQKALPFCKVVTGQEGLKELASWPSIDVVVSAMVGSSGIIPTVAAISAGKQIALANKEVLVVSGEYIMSLAKEKKVNIIPVDSEHSAIFQCLQGNQLDAVNKVVLTASGGPFLNRTQEDLEKITVEDALKHPNWKMGPKVTVDCSTLMNKGLEVIEAYFLFGLSVKQIEVLVHPESFIHSFVEYIDGSILAQMAPADMILPIQYALTYPERKKSFLSPFNFRTLKTLHFSEPDLNKFPCLGYVYKALEIKKSMLCYLNAINEVLVNRFLNKQISWKQIQEKIEKLLSLHKVVDVVDLEHILQLDQEARLEAEII